MHTLIPRTRCLNCRSTVADRWVECDVWMGQCPACGPVYLCELRTGNAVNPIPPSTT
jgi:hypothetical protein